MLKFKKEIVRIFCTISKYLILSTTKPMRNILVNLLIISPHLDLS